MLKKLPEYVVNWLFDRYYNPNLKAKDSLINALTDINVTLNERVKVLTGKVKEYRTQNVLFLKEIQRQKLRAKKKSVFDQQIFTDVAGKVGFIKDKVNKISEKDEYPKELPLSNSDILYLKTAVIRTLEVDKTLCKSPMGISLARIQTVLEKLEKDLTIRVFEKDKEL